ncbi:MAG: [protein-PII] uridylyltransferase [Alphaproteobacteria bacterium]|nr:[protein-PII] uridylyltransferase [Alphaproteobacteria bacterium]
MESVRQPRAIIDRRRLIAEVQAATERVASLAEQRAQVLVCLKRVLADGRGEVRRRFEASNRGEEAVAANAHLIDQILRVAYDFAAGTAFPIAVPTQAEHLALVATGGFGRGELAPQSDIDLLFLLPYKITARGEQVVEFLLYLLWDLGLKVGHATRTVEECIRRAKADLTIKTALLEARYIWGAQFLYDELRQRFQRDILGVGAAGFVRAKLAERNARHERTGGSRYVLEPNIKEGKGGLRDLHTLFWIAKFLYRVDTVAELVERKVLTVEEHATFAKAERFLWTVRCHLHYLTGRPDERLTFDVQPELARRMGYMDRTASRGVERFMKHYFLVAKDVGDLTRIFCATLEDEQRSNPRFRLPKLGLRQREAAGFRVEGQRLQAKGEDAFATDPVQLIRLFHVAQERELDIHPATLRLIRQNLKRIDSSLRGNPVANRLFLEILTSQKDPEVALRRMNEAGVLGRFVPDFGRVVAQMQHDMYHVYTVDEHSIFAIGMLHRMETGDLATELPLATQLIKQVLSRRALYLATFLHDIAKGRGGDHSELGAEIVLKLGPRLGLSEEETETATWLVRYHLLMSATAFKRDVNDPTTIADFAARVQSLERLRLLLVLTAADIRAVGPNVWNGWKGQLLRTLHVAAEEVISGGHSAEGRAARIKAAQAAFRAALPEWSAADLDAHVARLPATYWLTVATPRQVRHARQVREGDRAKSPLSLDSRVDARNVCTEVTLYTPDHVGLFSQMAGAIALAGANILDAQIFTTNDGMALDTFRIQGTDGSAFDRPGRLAKLAATVEQTLSGRLRPGKSLAGRSTLPTRAAAVFAVAPRVLIDNQASQTHTVIEVNGRDRPGLLHDVTRALSDLSLSIATAHVSTYGERAVDVFYVKDVFGMKITHEGKLARIRARLLEALADPTAAPGDAAQPPRRPHRRAAASS